MPPPAWSAKIFCKWCIETCKSPMHASITQINRLFYLMQKRYTCSNIKTWLASCGAITKFLAGAFFGGGGGGYTCSNIKTWLASCGAITKSLAGAFFWGGGGGTSLQSKRVLCSN